MSGPSLSVALRIARRELRGGLRGFKIFLACLALGVAAIASVQSLAGSVLDALQSQGREILGGDLAIRVLYQPINPEQQTYLDDSAAATTHFAELRGMARSLDGENATLVEVKAVDDSYPLYGAMTFTTADIAFPAVLEPVGGTWGAVVDPPVLERLGLQLGDRLQVGELDYEIRAIIDREPDRVGGGGNFGLGPRVMVAQDSLSATGLQQEGSMIYYQYRVQIPTDTNVATYRRDLEAMFPAANWRLRDYRNAAPRVERMVERLALFLTLVGLTALLVGGVGVSNAVRAYLDGKLNTIAVLKCVGAVNRTVFQAYMAQLLVLACGGIAIGLVLGALVPPLASVLLSQLLPFDLEPGIYPTALAIATVFGLLVTLTFAIWPLARVQQIPAAHLFRDAISAEHGRPGWRYTLATVIFALLLVGLAVGTANRPDFAFGFCLAAVAALLAFRGAASLVMLITARLARPRHPGLRLALANLHRPGAATPHVVLSLGLGLTVLVAIALVEGNMSRQVQESIPERAPSFFFVDIQSQQIDDFSATVDQVAADGELVRVPFLRGRIMAINGVPADEALRVEEHSWMIRGDRGVTFSATPPEEGEIISGEWWPADYSGPTLLSIHADMAEAFAIGVGDTVSVNVLGRDLDAEVANVRQQDWGNMQVNFLMTFSPQPLASAPHGYLATLSTAADNEAETQRTLSRAFPTVTIIRIKEALDAVNDVLRNIGAAVRSVAGITLLAGTLVLAGAIAAGHRRRVYESVVLKVLGATRRDVMKAFLLEYGLLGLITALIAAAVGTLAAWSVLTFVMNVPWSFLPMAVLTTTLLCTAITLGLGFFGTWRALGQKAAPLLRND